MSVSKTWTSDPENITQVLVLYKDKRLLTLQEVARALGTTYQNVRHVAICHMPPEEYRAHGSLRRSAAKAGDRNPMRGKTRGRHHNWVEGGSPDKGGYLMNRTGGRALRIHREVMAEALGLKDLPMHLEVHHIDNDPSNNNLDNLALVTRAGHSTIHSMQKDTMRLKSRASTLVHAWQSMTSE